MVFIERENTAPPIFSRQSTRHRGITEMAIEFRVIEEKLTDGSSVHRVTIRDTFLPVPSFSIDAISEEDALAMADKMRDAVAGHSNEDTHVKAN